MELIKQIVRVGNSAGVILPREWLNGEAKVTLVKRPLNVKEDIMKILKPYFEHIISISIVGSYSRDEQKTDSDVDVFVITDGNPKIGVLKVDKYEISFIPIEDLDNLKNNAIQILPMLREAKPILNYSVIQKYKSIKLNKDNLKWHFETTKSALDVLKGLIDLAKDRKGNISPHISYSLILRLRQILIVNALLRNKIEKNKDLTSLIKKLTGSIRIYDAYNLVKKNDKADIMISTDDAESVYNYIKNEIEKQEKWIKRKY